MTTVLLSNLWSDDNKGDLAITSGLVRALRAFDADVVVHGVSSFAAGRHERAHRFVKADLAVIHEPIWRPHDGEAFGAARRMSDLVVTLCVLVNPAVCSRLFRRTRPLVRAMAGADVVVAKGGQYLHDRSSAVRDQIGFLRQVHVLLLALRLNIPVALAGHSLRSPEGRTCRRLMAWLLKRATVIWLREPESLAVATSLGVTGLHVGSDTAFAFTRDVTGPAPAVGKVVVVPRWLPGKAIGDQRHLVRLAASLGEVGAPIVVVSHGLGPSPLETDTDCARRLHALLLERSVDSSLIEDDLSVAELVRLYGSADLVVAVRLHAAILAMAGGAPAIALAYDGPKTRGLYQKAGMSELTMDAEAFTPAELSRAISGVLGAKQHHRARARTFARGEADWLTDTVPRLLRLQP